MAYHAIFIWIGDGAFFQCLHLGKSFLDSRFHRLEERVMHVHPAQINCQAQFRELRVIFLEALLPLRLCKIYKTKFDRMISPPVLARKIAAENLSVLNLKPVASGL